MAKFISMFIMTKMQITLNSISIAVSQFYPKKKINHLIAKKSDKYMLNPNHR